MACEKTRVSCNECQFVNNQDRCPGVNFYREICDLKPIKESEILAEPEKKTFGKLFRSLQQFLPEINFNMLSSSRVSTLKRAEIIQLLKAVHHKDKELIPNNYVNLNNENISKLLYQTMIIIHERRNNVQTQG